MCTFAPIKQITKCTTMTSNEAVLSNQQNMTSFRYGDYNIPINSLFFICNRF